MLRLSNGLGKVAIQYYQRYSLSNLPGWLSQGEPSGHQRWAFINTPELVIAYANTFAVWGKIDKFIVNLECGE